MSQSHPNIVRLRRFVQASLERAAARDVQDAIAGLRRDAARVEHELHGLSRWAASKSHPAAPTHLAGLSAFDLSDAMDELATEARRRASRIDLSRQQGRGPS